MNPLCADIYLPTYLPRQLRFKIIIPLAAPKVQKRRWEIKKASAKGKVFS